MWNGSLVCPSFHPILCLTFRVGGKSNVEDYALAAEACLPIISGIVAEIKNNCYPTGCFLNIDLPTNVANHKVCEFYLLICCNRVQR